MTATADRIYSSGYNVEGKLTLLSGAMQHLAGTYRINGTFFLGLKEVPVEISVIGNYLVLYYGNSSGPFRTCLKIS